MWRHPHPEKSYNFDDVIWPEKDADLEIDYRRFVDSSEQTLVHRDEHAMIGKRDKSLDE